MGTGENLTSLGLFRNDLLGNTRPSSGAWNIGAYDYAADSGNPSANPPSITTQPFSQSAATNTSLTLSVSASGSGTLVYRWQSGGGPVTGATLSSYTTNSTGPATNAYSVIVSNLYGSVTSSTASLTWTNGTASTNPPGGGTGLWYVDSMATGANNGTNWANAWNSLSSIKWASVQAGNTVYISGGSTSQVYSNQLNASSVNGSIGNLITISAGQDSGHNGRVIIDGGGSASGLPYGVVLGSYQRLTGNCNGSNNLVIRNVLNATNWYSADAVYAWQKVGDVVDHVEVYTCNNGMNLIYATPVVVSNCYLHDIQGDHAICLNGSTGAYDANVVHDCTIQVNSAMDGTGTGPDGVQVSYGASVYNCNIYSASGTVNSAAGVQHQDGVQFTGSYEKFYNNTFTDLANSGNEGGPGSSGVEGYYMIYNNVYRIATASVAGYQRGIEWSPQTTPSLLTNVYICNNTFADVYGYYAIVWWWTNSAGTVVARPPVGNYVVENNIFYNCGGVMICPQNSPSSIGQTNFTVDYNAVYAGLHGKTLLAVSGSAYAQTHGQSGNVQFVAYANRTSSNDFHLQGTDTVAKDNGVSLSTLFTTDKDGIARPQGTAWDIGAYEFVTAVTKILPQPPANLHVVAIQ